MAKVMLIDDDESLQILIGQIAARDGHEYCCASNGTAGLEMLRAERPDFLILDVMLPDINGFEICELIRGEGEEVPILFLSSKGDIVDKSIGFKAGADDYLVKPFQPEELSLRVKAHLRRRAATVRDGSKSSKGRGTYHVGDLEIMPGKYEARLRGEPVAFSVREFELLELFASDPGSVFTREQIMRHLWGDAGAADPSSITVFVRKIREKIEDEPSRPRYLTTVWRVGYRLAEA